MKKISTKDRHAEIVKKGRATLSKWGKEIYSFLDADRERQERLGKRPLTERHLAQKATPPIEPGFLHKRLRAGDPPAIDPKPDFARRVHRALADLLEIPDIKVYLNAKYIAMEITLSKAEITHDEFAIALENLEEESIYISRFLRDGFFDFTKERFVRDGGDPKSPGRRKVLKLMFSLLASRKKRLLRFITGEKIAKTRYEEIAAAYEDYGIDLSSWKQENEKTRILAARENFQLVIDNVLIQTEASAGVRRDLKKEITSAFDDALKAQSEKHEAFTRKMGSSFDEYKSIVDEYKALLEEHGPKAPLNTGSHAK